MENEKIIKTVDGVRILRLYDGKWYAMFCEYRTVKTSQISAYSIESFKTWCKNHDVIPIF